MKTAIHFVCVAAVSALVVSVASGLFASQAYHPNRRYFRRY